MKTRPDKAEPESAPAADLELLERLRAAGPEGGLASIAGGWEDSDELPRVLEGVRRAPTRARPHRL